MSHSKILLSSLTSLFVLSSCTLVGPNFTPPNPKTPPNWSAPQPASQTDLTTWWKSFNDPQLNSLIKQAISANPSLQIAQTRVKQARASRRMAVSPFFPWLSDSANGAQGSPAGLSSGSRWSMSNILDASWELDIFGGNTRALEAADANLENVELSYNDVRISLISEVAMLYCDWLTYSEQISIAEQQLKFQQESEVIAKARFERGMTSKVDYDNAAAQVAETSAKIPPLRSAQTITKNNLAALLNKYPSELKLTLPDAKTLNFCPTVPVGIPSDLLRRRPDIRAAEAALHVATANIGVAVADLYPRFSLSGSFSTRGKDFSDFFKTSGSNWSLGGMVQWPIFQGGKLRANIDLQKALSEQAAITYRQTLLNAVAEVENALISYAQVKLRIAALQKAVDANRSAAELSIKLYVEGKTNFLNVIISQKSLLSSQESLIAANQNMRQYIITLSKALGGGWTDKRFKKN